jgi:isopentenyldiphosphate isomerase
MEFTMIYHTQSEEQPDPNPHEIMEGRWIHPDALDTWMQSEPKSFAGCFRLVWQTYREWQGNPSLHEGTCQPIS